MACLPSLEAAIAMTCADVTTPWPPRPDMRILIRRLIIETLLYVVGSRLRESFFGRGLLGLVLLRKVGQKRLCLVVDKLLIVEPLARLLGVAHLLEAFHAVLADLQNTRRVELQIRRPDLAGNQHGIPDHVLYEGGLADRAVHDIHASR